MSPPDEIYGIPVVMLTSDMLNENLNCILTMSDAPPDAACAVAVDVQVGRMILPLLERLLE